MWMGTNRNINTLTGKKINSIFCILIDIRRIFHTGM